MKNIWQILMKEENKSIRYYVRNLLLIFLFAFAVLVAGTIITLNKYKEVEKNAYREVAENVLATKLENIQDEVKSATSDLMMLAESRSLKNFWSDKAGTIEDLKAEFFNLSFHHEVFDQVRLIDETGMEIVRINKTSIVTKDRLQSKKDRYYFYDSFKLNRNEVFISPLDLNVENGEIEQPLKPMIRFATPVFDDQNVKRGVVVLNYYGQIIINKFVNHSNLLIEDQLMFLNSDGYWFKGQSTDDEWGFMYEDKLDVTFKKRYGAVWDSIAATGESQFETKKGLFTFKTVYPIPKNLTSNSNGHLQIGNDYHWKIVSIIPHRVLNEKSNLRWKQAVFFIAVLAISWLLIFYRLARTQYYKIKSQEELREREITLRELNSTKDKLFTIIAHDLINPFNSILGFSVMLHQQMKLKDYEGIEEYTEIIHDSSSRAMDLLSNLLEWSRSQIGQIAFNPVLYDLNKQIRGAVLLLTDTAEIKSIKITTQIPSDFTVFAHKEMINTVVRNLISNAVKFTMPDGEVIVSAEKNEDEVIISVCDNGVGISPEHLSKLFQVSETHTSLGTAKEKGTGLGLMLCKDFIEKHKGRIWAESEVGKGSCFKFSLPNCKGETNT
ncbi:sensor histidine kinase [Labilibaculum sp. K2S]|uniref:sensor histidine kinase n=1 Tax=Labilibaculum sp. K2S TaxID=3056386 RepID=UPI0025A3C2D4|nr:sensor histidine kinase [Labilibaculum sp. K2S]MDM8160221.1 sensor histidine kinase [Labilibaculum sp. K2S]